MRLCPIVTALRHRQGTSLVWRFCLLLVSVAAGCAPTTTISGEVTFSRGVPTTEDGRVVGCRHIAPNADIGEGTLVLLREKRTDIVLAQGALVISPNALGRAGCTYSYEIPAVPHAEMYSIRVEGRPFGRTYTREALAIAGWVVETMELDTP